MEASEMGAVRPSPRQRARNAARHGALDLLSTGWRVSARERRAVAAPRIHLPYLHAVPEHEEQRFRDLLDWLGRSHTFIGYPEAVDRVLTGRIDRPYVAFSFDDGFASNVRTARILEDYGTTGCFFVVTGFIGTRTLPEAREFFGYANAIDEHAMTWDDVESLKARGHEIGNHTHTHRQISDLSVERAREEIGTAADMLRTRLGRVDHFAWPFGRFGHFTDEAARLVFAAGHVSCASAERGAHPSGPAPLPGTVCLRRDHLMTSWPLRHSRYFLAHSAAAARPGQQGWPASWEVPV
jgi:peptidoglycan/xylan/chitin deacetylase (PgdA/CDA1 family)